MSVLTKEKCPIILHKDQRLGRSKWTHEGCPTELHLVILRNENLKSLLQGKPNSKTKRQNQNPQEVQQMNADSPCSGSPLLCNYNGKASKCTAQNSRFPALTCAHLVTLPPSPSSSPAPSCSTGSCQALGSKMPCPVSGVSRCPPSVWPGYASAPSGSLSALLPHPGGHTAWHQKCTP